MNLDETIAAINVAVNDAFDLIVEQADITEYAPQLEAAATAFVGVEAALAAMGGLNDTEVSIFVWLTLGW